MVAKVDSCSCMDTGDCSCVENGECNCECDCVPCVMNEIEEGKEDGCGCGGNCGCGTNHEEDGLDPSVSLN